jgi:hypothetical protein
LSGWLPGSFTTVPVMEDACAVGAGSCALAGSKALRKKKAKTSERVMEIP